MTEKTRCILHFDCSFEGLIAPAGREDRETGDAAMHSFDPPPSGKKGQPHCTKTITGEEPWSPSQASMWEKELEEWRATHKCVRCNSDKIPQQLNGRPNLLHVQWHKMKSKELGWETLHVVGCGSFLGTKDPELVCADCERIAY